MNSNNFAVELSSDFSFKETIYARILYQAIIGPKAISLYMALLDYYLLANKQKKVYITSEILMLLDFNQNDLIIAKSKLEALGLIRSFLLKSNSLTVFILNKPLNALAFSKNSILLNSIKEKKANLIFEKIFNYEQLITWNKDKFTETTKSYHDVLEMPKITINSTIEVDVSDLTSNADAIKSLSFSQYVFYLLNRKIWPSLLEKLSSIQTLGYSSESINLLIDHSMKINDKIVANYIYKIATNFLDDNILLANDVRQELLQAQEFKLNSNITKEAELTSSNTKKKSNIWDDVFSSK